MCKNTEAAGACSALSPVSIPRLAFISRWPSPLLFPYCSGVQSFPQKAGASAGYLDNL